MKTTEEELKNEILKEFKSYANAEFYIQGFNAGKQKAHDDVLKMINEMDSEGIRALLPWKDAKEELKERIKTLEEKEK